MALIGKDLSAERRAAKNKIDDMAGEIRARFFRSTPGQESEYAEKRAEARAFRADIDALVISDATFEATYPMIWSDMLVDGSGRLDAVVAIETQAAAWVPVLKAVNEMRRRAKLNVDAATSVAGIHGQYDLVSFDLLPAPMRAIADS